MVVPPVGIHVFHTNWVLQTKTDAATKLGRFKARLVASGNEQVFAVYRPWIDTRCGQEIGYHKGHW